LTVQSQPDHEDCFLHAIEERTGKSGEQSYSHSKVESAIHKGSAMRLFRCS
jgi:hypothetical protein